MSACMLFKCDAYDSLRMCVYTFDRLLQGYHMCQAKKCQSSFWAAYFSLLLCDVCNRSNTTQKIHWKAANRKKHSTIICCLLSLRAIHFMMLFSFCLLFSLARSRLFRPSSFDISIIFFLFARLTAEKLWPDCTQHRRINLPNNTLLFSFLCVFFWFNRMNASAARPFVYYEPAVYISFTQSDLIHTRTHTHTSSLLIIDANATDCVEQREKIAKKKEGANEKETKISRENTACVPFMFAKHGMKTILHWGRVGKSITCAIVVFAHFFSSAFYFCLYTTTACTSFADSGPRNSSRKRPHAQLHHFSEWNIKIFSICICIDPIYHFALTSRQSKLFRQKLSLGSRLFCLFLFIAMLPLLCGCAFALSNGFDWNALLMTFWIKISRYVEQ